jgi:hypothetical protein
LLQHANLKTCKGLKATAPSVNLTNMYFEDFLIRQFDEINTRLKQVEIKLDYGQQTLNVPVTYDSNTAAKLLGISTRTLSKYRKERLIGFVQNGRKIIYTKEQIDGFLGTYKVDSITSKSKSHGKQYR